MKKLLAILMALSLALSISACANTEQGATTAPATSNSASSSSTAGSETPATDAPLPDPETVNVYLWANGAPPTSEAVALVNEKLNEITVPEINVKMNLNITDIGTYIGTMATMVAANEDIDIMCTFPAAAPHFNSMVSQGMLMPIDNLLAEHGQDIMTLIPDAWWQAVTRDGQVYSVPRYANTANDFGIMFVKEWFDETGFKPEDIKTMDDIGNVLRAFKEKHPDKIALSGDNRTLDFTFPLYDIITNSYFDALGDSTAIAAIVPFDKNGSTDYKVVSRYESESFQTIRKTLQAWYNEGLIDRDAMTHHGRGMVLTVAENVFAAISVSTPTSQATRNTQSIHDAYHIKLMTGANTTAGTVQMTWGLPVSCDVPESAMKLLNLMFSDERIINLISFGVEGEHYVMNANGQMAFPEGITAENSPYFPNCSAYVPNALINKTWEWADPNTPALEEASIKNSVASPLLGFAFDTAPVADIYAIIGPLALEEVGPAIFTGAASDAVYEEFIKRLYDAGLEKYLAEMQSQVDAWVAANK